METPSGPFWRPVKIRPVRLMTDHFYTQGNRTLHYSYTGEKDGENSRTQTPECFCYLLKPLWNFVFSLFSSSLLTPEKGFFGTLISYCTATKSSPWFLGLSHRFSSRVPQTVFSPKESLCGGNALQDSLWLPHNTLFTDMEVRHSELVCLEMTRYKALFQNI